MDVLLEIDVRRGLESGCVKISQIGVRVAVVAR